MCVNDLIVQAAEPLFFLDYFACGKLETGVAEQVIEGIALGCKEAGCALIGGETAEMPGMYADGEYDLAGFSVGAVERAELRPKETITQGDLIIGLSSSGVHSNGFSLVRKIIESAGLSIGDPAPFATGISLGQALLEPTRIYVRPVLTALQSGIDLKALAHITGGGLTENLPRVLKPGLQANIDLAAITPPPVFAWLRDAGQIEETEMIRTFNCGVGMALITNEKDAAQSLKSFEEAGIKAGIIGEIRQGETPFEAINQLNYTAT